MNIEFYSHHLQTETGWPHRLLATLLVNVEAKQVFYNIIGPDGADGNVDGGMWISLMRMSEGSCAGLSTWCDI